MFGQPKKMHFRLRMEQQEQKRHLHSEQSGDASSALERGRMG